MRSTVLLLVVALLVGAVPVAGPPPASAQAPVDDAPIPCLPHPPIHIEGDQGPLGFILGYDTDGEPIYRPGAGVVAGHGTPQDPYVIAGWCLASTGTGTVTSALRLIGTRAHVEIRDNLVTGLPRGGHGIFLDGATNAEIHGNQISDHDWDGIRLDGASGNLVHNNTIDASLRYGIIAMYGGNGNVIENNTITNHIQYSIYILVSAGNTVRHNELSGSQVGLRFLQGYDNVARFNQIHGNDYGVSLSHSGGNLVQDNDIHGNEDLGLQVLDASSAVDARSNWWGCPLGPNQAGCDGASGWYDASDWRLAPVPGAGP